MTLAESPPAPSSWRQRIFAASWLSYFTYYFLRKNYSVVKADLGLPSSKLKEIETIYLACYAVGQFVSGATADRVGPRRLVTAGMLAAAAAGVWFGLGNGFWTFYVAFAVQGLVQSTGWPGNTRVMATWFHSRERGQVMGWWCTCYQAGGLAATYAASYLGGHAGWRAAWFVPAGYVAAIGVAYWIAIRDRPSDVGFADPDPRPADPAEAARARRAGWGLVLGQPMTWAMGASYFCMKLMRYSLLFWLPWYLKKELGYKTATAGYMSTSFEVGGIAGVVLAGFVADRLLDGRRVATAAIFLALLAGALGAYSGLGARDPTANYLIMIAIGALLFGADSLVSGAVAQDLGGPHAAALAAGIINGIGSIGAVAQGYVTDGVSRAYGWDTLFYVFQLTAVAGALVLLPFIARRPRHRVEAA